MSEAPASSVAFRELLRTLDEVVTSSVEGDDTMADIDVVEGYRFVLHLLSGAVEHRLEADPERPLFRSIVGPDRKFLGDNPDARYFWSRIRDDRSYRIRGRRTDEVYVSITIHGPDPGGGAQQAVLDDINLDDLDVDAEGNWELVLEPWISADGIPGTGRLLPLGAESVITRHYFARPVSVNADPSTHIELAIEPLEDPGPPPPWSDAQMADRLSEVSRFIRAETLDRATPEELGPISFVSREPNVLPVPASFRESGLDTVGAVDIHYAMGPFVLGPTEALVMEGTLPEARFINVMLWNRHLQTLEYRYRQTSLSHAQLLLGPDRSFRVVVCAQDPHQPNWLDTEGRSIGAVFWRFVLPESVPEQARCRVVDVSELG